MIILRCEQGSPEWTRARLGIATSSKFDKIITPARLGYSAASERYRNELLAEWLTGYPLEDNGRTDFMQRGERLEPEARAKYGFLQDVEVEEVGAILRDDRKVGCSPDGLVGESGGLEIKAPAIHTHIGYMLDPESLVKAYHCQVQGSLWLTGREWWDLMSYHPTLDEVLVRVEPDPDFHAAFGEHIETFLADLETARQTLLDMGHTPAPPLPTAESLEAQDRERQVA